MRLAKILTPLFVLLLLGFGGWRLSRYIASKHRAFQGREFAQAHPLLQWLGRNQSVTQNGYTLLAVQDAAQPFQYQGEHGGGNYASSVDSRLQGGTAFWIRLDNPPAGLPSYASSRTVGNSNYPLFTVLAHSSDGDTFPLDWELNSTGPILSATLSAGYPNTYHWVEVIVDDHYGHKAVWRISHLPPTQHLIPPPVRVMSAYKSDGVTLTASAWRQQDPYNKPHAVLAMYHMHGTIRPYQHQWEVAFLDHQWEWGMPNAPQQSGIMSVGFSGRGDFNNGEDVIGNDYSGNTHPYLNHNHYVRLLCELRQFETYTETVTFRNVPIRAGRDGRAYVAPIQAISQTTPSGVKVTLSDPRSLAPASAGTLVVVGQPGINYSADDKPKVGAETLARSPLYRRYRKVVTVSLAAQPPSGYFEAVEMVIGNARVTTFTRQTGLQSTPTTSRLSADGKTLKTFSFSVQQRVDLQKIPLTFTVPIGEHR